MTMFLGSVTMDANPEGVNQYSGLVAFVLLPRQLLPMLRRWTRLRQPQSI